MALTRLETNCLNELGDFGIHERTILESVNKKMLLKCLLKEFATLCTISASNLAADNSNFGIVEGFEFPGELCFPV